jgi:uracil-DNA glycosylase
VSASRLTDPHTRAEYLRTLGIDTWHARTTQVLPPQLDSRPLQANAVPHEPVDWETLRVAVSTCTKCALHSGRTQTVFGVGAERAEWLVIGEAPGAEEDRQGEPFVGRAGQLLNAMLRSIGLPRETVFIANILKCRPPGNRDPRAEEVASCLPYLQGPLARLRGRVHEFGERSTPLIVTYHPAYLLRSPGEKRKAWDDLKFARATYKRLVGAAA